MKLKRKKIMQGVYGSSLLCAVVRQSSTGLVLLGGNPPPAVVAFRPRPAAAAASSWRRRHEAPCRRAHHHTVSRIGRRFQCRHPVLQGRRLGGGWEGDDVRMWTRLRRKLRRRLLFQAGHRPNAAKMILLALQLLVYVGQIVTTIIALQRTFASYWQASPQYVFGMVIDAITGSTVVAHSPVVRAFGFSATLASSSTRRLNVYRYLTSGFVHSGLLPLLINVGVMLKLQPSWLSRSLGASLYLTTFLGAIILGNMAHVVNTTSTGGGFLAFDFTTYLGSSAGLCGVYGLMFVCLTRMGQANPSKNSNRSSGNGGGFTQLLQGMLILLGVGAWMEHVNVAMNLGGFVGGILLGILCGPGYTNDYSMTRKNSVGYDPVDRDYRAVMGFGIMPTERGWIPLKVLQAILLTIFLAVPQYRNIPVAILKGVWNLI